ncbi:hypothetical protein [Caballeronia sp. NK8]|uniref:hypothetical protein n=1 Tax=Caballeronia sp. NK8 TaxID=140098 RepID=UPI001BD154DE|nr:hypothetical protein [Caballeronia sp. NK8]
MSHRSLFTSVKLPEATRAATVPRPTGGIRCCRLRRSVVLIASSKPGYLRISGHFKPAAQPFTPGGKDGIADRFCGHPVYLPAYFPNMTSSGLIRTELAQPLDLKVKSSAIDEHSRSIPSRQ